MYLDNSRYRMGPEFLNNHEEMRGKDTIPPLYTGHEKVAEVVL